MRHEHDHHREPGPEERRAYLSEPLPTLIAPHPVYSHALLRGDLLRLRSKPEDLEGAERGVILVAGPSAANNLANASCAAPWSPVPA
eukprot:11377716-Alexandrium_andersonii.AAC.1